MLKRKVESRDHPSFHFLKPLTVNIYCFIYFKLHLKFILIIAVMHNIRRTYFNILSRKNHDQPCNLKFISANQYNFLPIHWGCEKTMLNVFFNNKNTLYIVRYINGVTITSRRIIDLLASIRRFLAILSINIRFTKSVNARSIHCSRYNPFS